MRKGFTVSIKVVAVMVLGIIALFAAAALFNDSAGTLEIFAKNSTGTGSKWIK